MRACPPETVGYFRLPSGELRFFTAGTVYAIAYALGPEAVLCDPFELAPAGPHRGIHGGWRIVGVDPASDPAGSEPRGLYRRP